MKKKAIAVAKLLFILVAVLLIVQPEGSYAASLDATVYKGSITFNGKTIANDKLYYPMIKVGDCIYFPVSKLDLPLLKLTQGEGEGESLVIKKGNGSRSANPTEKSNDVVKEVTTIDVHVKYDGKLVSDDKHPSVMCLERVYIPLTAKTLKTFGYYSVQDKELGLIIDSRSKAEIDKYLESTVDQEDLLLAKYIIKVNGNISQQTASNYVDIVSRSADKYKVDRVWVMAIIWQESRFNEKSKGGGAYGMMQMMEATGRTMGVSKEELLEAETSIDKGVAYLKIMINRFDGDVKKGILAYNQGERNVSRGTYKTWYLEDVTEKYQKIKGYLQTNSK